MDFMGRVFAFNADPTLRLYRAKYSLKLKHPQLILVLPLHLRVRLARDRNKLGVHLSYATKLSC